ncbi:MAG: hypothetical protein FJZ01_05800 [Candidatus Sericytochromatia bacterium]|nr:hypothetical protein [Candidatus Tanganyikabacteria bacterium]
MYDAQGQYEPPSRAFSRRHSSGRWQTRTLLDFPSAARKEAVRSRTEAPNTEPRETDVRKFDIEALLAEVTELSNQLAPRRGAAEIRQFPQREAGST